MKRAQYVLFVALLAGCTTVSDEGQGKKAEILPPDFRAQIVKRLHDEFYDPYSVRDAELTTKAAGWVTLKGRLPSVCVRANAKNLYGAYAGKRIFYVTFMNSKILAVGNQIGSCGDDWVPFPELNGKG